MRKDSAPLALILLVIFPVGFRDCQEQGQWVSLFNGKDLSYWDTYIGAEYTGGDWNEWTKGPKLGLNNDPDSLFRIGEIDGESVIHITGARFGGLSTQQEYENYHLQLQFKWGIQTYAPKKDSPRDSGLLYHGVGEHGADSGFWLRSQEFQIQEGDTGDYWGCAGATCDVPVRSKGINFIYDPTGDLIHFSPELKQGRHVVKSHDAEMPSGEWNTIDLYCFKGTSIHVINGQKNMILYNSSQISDKGQEIPLIKGKIQLQSEGAEIFYRSIRIRPIVALPIMYFE